MKVAIIASTLARAGPVRVILGLVRALAGKVEFVVITLSPEPQDSLRTEFTEAGCRLRSLDLSRAEFIWAGARQLRRVLSEEQPDAVHTHGIRADLSCALLRQPRVVSTLHCTVNEDYRFRFGAVAGAIASWGHGRALKRLDTVVAVSGSVRSFALRAGVIRTTVIPNGVDVSVFRPGTSERRQLTKRSLGWMEDIVFVVVAHLVPLKDPLTVTKSWMLSSLKSARLVFIGDGPELPACRAHAEGAPNPVEFVGRVQDVSHYLQAADVVVSASHCEGLPLALLEGLATGLRCIATDILPHRELADAYPGSVELFDVGNVHRLAELLSGCQQEVDQVRERRHSAVVMRHSTSAMADRYGALYAGIASEQD